MSGFRPWALDEKQLFQEADVVSALETYEAHVCEAVGTVLRSTECRAKAGALAEEVQRGGGATKAVELILEVMK